MKLRKIITALLILNSVSMNVNAQITADINADKQCIDIKVENEAPKTYLSLRVEGKEGSEYVLLKQFKTDNNGNYTGSYPLKANSGDYVIKIHINGGDTLAKEVFFSNAEDLKIFFSGIISEIEKAAVTGIYDDLKTVIDNNRKYMSSVDFASYDEIISGYTDDDIYKYVAAQEKAGDVTELSAQINQAIAIKKVKESSSVQTLKDNADILGITDTDIYTFFESLSEGAKANTVLALNVMHNTVDEFENSFSKAVMLEGLIEKNYREYDTVINICKNVITPSLYTRYERLSESKKVEVCKAIYGKNIKDYTVFESTFSNAITLAENVIITNVPSGGGGGGGSSSSNGKSSSVITGVPVVTKPIEETVEEKKLVFTDMDKTEWAKEAVGVLAEKKIVYGKTETEFCPADRITREEFLALILRGFDIESDGNESKFSDVKKGAWYYNTVATAEKFGIVSGINETHFGTGRSITRQEMCVIAHRAAGLKGVKFENTEVMPFDDGIAKWAETAVSELYASEIVSGVGEREFMAEYSATRAEASVLIYKLLSFAGLL